MSFASAHLTNSDPIKSGNFERNRGRRTLGWVKTALPTHVIATRDHVRFAGKEQWVTFAATHCDDVFVKDIKSVNSYRITSTFDPLNTQLTAFIVTPSINLRSLLRLIRRGVLWLKVVLRTLDLRLSCCGRWLSDSNGEIFTTGHRDHRRHLEGFNEAWWARLTRIIPIWGTGGYWSHAKLPDTIRAHHVEMPRTCDDARVFFSASNLRNDYVEGAGAGHANKISQIKVLSWRVRGLKLRINAELTLSVVTPHENFSVFDLVHHILVARRSSNFRLMVSIELLRCSDRSQIVILTIFFFFIVVVWKGSFVCLINFGWSLII